MPSPTLIDARFTAYLVVSAVSIIAPGPDMALVTRNAVARAARSRFGSGMRRAIERLTGVVLIGLGLRLAAERR